MGGMQQQLMQAMAFGGSPVAAGGLGVFDPMGESQSMLGDGSDPLWEQAVRQAAQGFGAGGPQAPQGPQLDRSRFSPYDRVAAQNTGYRRFFA